MARISAPPNPRAEARARARAAVAQAQKTNANSMVALRAEVVRLAEALGTVLDLLEEERP